MGFNNQLESCLPVLSATITLAWKVQILGSRMVDCSLGLKSSCPERMIVWILISTRRLDLGKMYHIYDIVDAVNKKEQEL